MKKLLTSFLLLFLITSSGAQYRFEVGKLPKKVSLKKFASILDVENRELSIDQVIMKSDQLQFKPLITMKNGLGYTNQNYWVKFDLYNASNTPLLYYLEAADPATNNVDLYLISENKPTGVQRSGDNLDFTQKSVANRKNIFKIELAAGEKKRAYISIKTDGQINKLPLVLKDEQTFFNKLYHEQFLLGIFYGLLTIIIITYFFFFIALKEIVFLYYAAYVFFAGLSQFASDGLYHQYLGTSNSWLNLHVEILTIIFASFCFAGYSEIMLNIRERNLIINRCFKFIYILLSIIFLSIIFFPGSLKYAYPTVSTITVFGMLLILLFVVISLYKKQSLDGFYVAGISILFVTLILVILMNLEILPQNFLIHNIVKPVFALEIIALSLSMANRIRLLKSKEQEHQAVALQKAEELNNIKSYFLSNMSHELRTPLNVILGLAAIMENESNDARLRANCEVIKYTSKGLLSSVSDILDFSRIEEGELKLDKSEFSLYETLYELASSAGKQSRDKGITFDFNSAVKKDVYVIGDRTRLEQIIYNILGNAIKFTSKGNIIFEIKATSTVDTIQLNIMVKDTGVGIPKEKLATIFELFSQTNFDNKRRYGGFGIGLSIVKALTDLHNGSIKINSEPDQGTTCEIVITYPLQQPKEAEINIYSLVDYDLMGKHILIVEDNPMNQMIIQLMMSDWKNTKVSLANDGAECLELIKKESVDLILMDLQMPVMDGYEAISAIKKGDAGASNINIPIIVITADITKATKERLSKLGVAGYMYKPIDEKILYQKITTAFSKEKILFSGSDPNLLNTDTGI
ncbi:hybrid sensor histidine kinase/response regulator [Pedobacter rhodius]|uniref:histidine kinase n=1 Tax=Pedobacter rhodius TaxID=3004098 RepID=A0ABT4KZ70_9SPHI|nr:hybrid sensor histidine kinase/response regulator [Pedobacter sp. SJ11]MCZ4224238.1 ATP-binding protein [Pedobacter sp. SJ11]